MSTHDEGRACRFQGMPGRAARAPNSTRGVAIKKSISVGGIREPEDLHAEFWRHQERLSAAVQSWLGTEPSDADDFNGIASVYFAELEGRLEESLGFASRALLFDHTSSARSFSYDTSADRVLGLELLEKFKNSEPVLEGQGGSVKFVGPSTMHPLVRGYGVLADILTSLRARKDDFKRPSEDFPDYANSAVLQSIPFRSTVPFLDISEHSQERIVKSLTQIRDALFAANIGKIRNEYSHYRRTSPGVAEMVGTLEAVGQVIRSIESLGCGPNLFTPAGESTDQRGRRLATFTGPRRPAHAITRLSSLQWAGLLSFRKNQFLVRLAAFDDANEVLRFTRAYTSDFSAMWANYPRPRRMVNRAAEGSSSSEPGQS